MQVLTDVIEIGERRKKNWIIHYDASTDKGKFTAQQSALRKQQALHSPSSQHLARANDKFSV